MADDPRDPQSPRPPAQAAAPGGARQDEHGGAPVRNTAPSADDGDEPSTDEPRHIDLGTRSFGGTNMAADQRRQGRERGMGLGAGGSDNRAARHGEGGDREVPTDDLD